MRRFFFYMLFLIMTADGLMVFLTPVVVYLLTGSIEYSGLSYAMWWLPRLLFIPVIGRFIDSLGIRILSVFSDMVKITGCLSLILFDINDNFWIAITFGLLGSLISIGNAQTIIAYEKLILLFSNHKTRHINLLSRMDFLGMIVGSATGMLLMEQGYKPLLAIACVLYLINCLFFFCNRQLKNEPSSVGDINITKGPFLLKQSQEIFILILTTPVLLLSVSLAAGNNMFDGLVESAGVALIDKNMDLPIKYFGIIDIAAGIFGVIGTYFYSYLAEKLSRKYLLIIATVLITASSYMLVIFSDSLQLFVFCYAISVTGKVFSGNTCRLIRIEVIPARIFASTSSVLTLLNQLILPVVGLILFFSEGTTGLALSLMLLSICITLVSGIMLISQLKSCRALMRNA